MRKKFTGLLLALLAYTLLCQSMWILSVGRPPTIRAMGKFQQNDLLKRIETVEMKGAHGPEDL